MNLPALRADLERMLSANATAHVSRVTRIILDSLDGRARKFLRLIDDEEKRAPPPGEITMLNIHGGAPAIRDIVRLAAWHRERGLIKREMAA